MKDIDLKLRLIYVPFLLTMLFSVSAYALIRWGLDIKLGLLPFSSATLSTWVPLFIAPLLVWLLLKERILLLKLHRKQGSVAFAYYVYTSLAICVPIALSQTYIGKASFELVQVDNVEAVRKYPDERYLELSNFALDQEKSRWVGDYQIATNKKSYLRLKMYVVCPLKEVKSTWLGVEYSKVLDDPSSDEARMAEFYAFRDDKIEQFRSSEFQSSQYFEQLEDSDDRDMFIDAVKNADSTERLTWVDPDKQIILRPVFKKFEASIRIDFFWIFGSMAISAAIFLLLILFPGLDRQRIMAFQQKSSSENLDNK